MSVEVSAISLPIVKASFTGRNGAGAISAPGLKVGDAVFLLNPGGYVLGVDAGGASGSIDVAGIIEAIVSVDDELQQVAMANFSTTNFTAFLVRGF